MAFDANGALAAGVAEAYWESGFYVFEGAVRGDELNELVADFEEVLAQAPVSSTSDTDASGRPAIGSEFDLPSFRFARPLSDPYGGTSVSGGRYQAKMVEPEAPVDAPDEVLLNISSPLQLMDSALQLYGHPDLLRIAEQINGPDFTPFSESIWVKQPGWGRRWPGTRTGRRTGTVPIWTRVPTASTSWYSCTGARRPMGFG